MSDDRSECSERKRRAMNGVPCGPLIRPYGPPSPRWGEEGASHDLLSLRHLSALTTPTSAACLPDRD
ncbi:hypothetical protein E0H35_28780 [Rhizobium leguminosarum bv. viciae]|nr:hypothetical protein [Rhizobium leguminosarum bv. viciae]NKL22431.1 hypothetical protein [Rhizobium leguminosarum bv. viciae]NKL56557.1 hypothetical protein [Rhizobium leguminosarum bv. viciae]TBG81323.1 hypothetical protein ELG76_18985 [Rhizobium leguminosarum]TBY91872.1 hypothetical protein E0H35_28780 [Rhizobium leguminosarum bv. viciae]